MNIRFTYLLSLLSATLLAACSDPVDEYLNGEGTPTPLNVSISLSDAVQKVQSRAVDNSFEANDVLLAYFQHIDGSGYNVTADMAPALVTFKVNANPVMDDTDEEAKKKTSSLTVTSIKYGDTEITNHPTLYWDDFSDSRNPATDLRTIEEGDKHHGLRTLYGYCFNGKAPAPTISDVTTGKIDWTVATNQTSGIKTNDLLWSHTIEKQAYTHKDNKDDEVGLTIPYLHAMSKVTIILKAGDGFDKDPFDNTTVTLQSLKTKCTVDAAQTQITVLDPPADITMAKSATTETVDGKRARVFEAIVVPNNVWNKDATLAVITDMNGNDYYISVTDNILKGFLKKETLGADDNKVTLESGKNYKLVITLDKQPQTIVATITDWNNVSATGTGAIKFENNISHNIENGTFTNGDQITLWRGTANDNNASYDEDGSTNNIIDKATTCTLNGTNWTNDPQIYWPNGSTNYYFRALTKHNGSNYEAFTGEDYGHEARTDLMVYEGTDLLWGTTAKHTGNIEGGGTHNYEKGAAINPRTSTVPMEFEHIMSKVTIKLETTNDAAKVDLSEAKVTFSNYSIGGKVSLVDGNLCSSSIITEGAGYSKVGPVTTATTTTVINGGLFLPQQLDRENFITKLIITLKDGTTYSLNLMDCNATDAEGNNIPDEWLRGKHYTYTIHLEKEAITFRALVKNWEEATGSGNATLDWD